VLARREGVARLLTVGCDFHFAGTWRAWIEPPYGYGGFPDSDYESNRCSDEATVPSVYNGGYVCNVVFLLCLPLGGPRRQMLLSLSLASTPCLLGRFYFSSHSKHGQEAVQMLDVVLLLPGRHAEPLRRQFVDRVAKLIALGGYLGRPLQQDDGDDDITRPGDDTLRRRWPRHHAGLLRHYASLCLAGSRPV
jgi:hypothetical protein